MSPTLIYSGGIQLNEKNIEQELEALRKEIQEMVQTATKDVLTDVHALLVGGKKTV